MDTSTKHYVVLIRHGERSDFKGLTPQFGKLDPELTKHGEEQAYTAGQLLSDELLNQIKIDPKTAKIQLISSPFVRTLQTSRNVLKGIIDKGVYHISPIINIEYYLGEMVGEEFRDDYPLQSLKFLNQNDLFKEEFKHETFNVFSKDTSTLPNYVETEPMCEQRMKTYIEYLLPELSKNKEYNITLLISHGEPINEMNKHLGYKGPYGWRHIKYCNTFYYEIDTTLQQSVFLNNIIPPQ